MVPLVCQENEEHVAHREIREIKVHPVKTDVQERMVLMVSTANPEIKEEKEIQVIEETSEHTELLGLQDFKVTLARQVFKDPMDLEDQTEAPDSLENVAKKEQLGLLVPQVNQELLGEQEQKDTRDRWDDMVWLDPLDPPEKQVTLAHLAHKDKQAHKEGLGIRDRMDHQETQDQKDQLETKDKLETKDPLDLQEIMVFQEMLVHLDPQDHQDHLETYQAFLPEVSGTDLMVARRDQDGTEANVQSLTIQRRRG